MKRLYFIRKYHLAVHVSKHLLSLVSLILAGIFISACISAPPSTQSQKGMVGPAPEYSLKEDRAQLDKMRKDIPEDIRQRNDEWALVLSMLSDESQQPTAVRQKFSDLVRKVRRKFDSDHRKEREDFNRAQKTKRNDFLSGQRAAKNAIAGKKLSREESKEFYDRQSRESREFYAKLRSDENEFGADQRRKRSDFEAYIREKQKHFDQEYRDFSRRHQELKREKSGRSSSNLSPYERAKSSRKSGFQTFTPEAAAALREFEEFPNTPGTPL
jgi:hypothetical protein